MRDTAKVYKRKDRDDIIQVMYEDALGGDLPVQSVDSIHNPTEEYPFILLYTDDKTMYVKYKYFTLLKVSITMGVPVIKHMATESPKVMYLELNITEEEHFQRSLLEDILPIETVQQLQYLYKYCLDNRED